MDDDERCMLAESHRVVKNYLSFAQMPSYSLQKQVVLNNKVCSEMCSQQVLMVDDVPFNLIPLEGMLEAKDIKFTSCF